MNRNVLAVFTFLASSASLTSAAIVGPGNLVVSQVGDGSAALTNASTAVFLKEFDRTASSAVVQTVGVPTSGTYRLTNSGSASSELQLTYNKGYVSLAGYDSATGVTGIASTSTSGGTPVPRQAIGYNVFSDLGTGPAVGGTTTGYSGNNIRSAVTVSGNLYAGGGNTGQVYITNGGSGAGTIVSTTITNSRVVNNFNGNLYYSTGSGTTRGIYEIPGEPTTAGNTATNIINMGSTGSPYSFWINDAGDLAYISDDRNAAGGGIQKWTKTSSVWSLAYTISTDYDAAGAAPTGATGLAVDASGANPTLFFIHANATRLGVVTDLGTQATAEGSLSILQVAPTNTAFRGVAIPEPATLGLIGLVGLVGLRRRASR